MRDLCREDIESVIEDAIRIETLGLDSSLTDKRLANLFFEESTRTRGKMKTAAWDLGMKVFDHMQGKTEPLKHAAKMYEGWGYDIIAMRHFLDGAARHVADVVNIGVINCGDYNHAHPTQALQDLKRIKQEKGTLDGLKIAIGGDLLHSRAAHDFLYAISKFDIELAIIPPNNRLNFPKHMIEDYIEITGKEPTLLRNPTEALKDFSADVYHNNRIKRERYQPDRDGQIEFENDFKLQRITEQTLDEGKSDVIIMDPLPINKLFPAIDPAIDDDPRVVYYQQSADGVPVSKVIIKRLLEQSLIGRRKNHTEQEEVWRDLPITHGSKIGKKLVYRLGDGTSIDRIEHGRGLLAFFLLGLYELDTPVVPALGIDSQEFDFKDALAVHNVYLTENQLSLLALISKTARVNIIENDQVKRKGQVVLQREIEGILQCQNRNCVSWPDHNEYTTSKFYVEKIDPLRVRCHYCEKPMKREDVAQALVMPLSDHIHRYLLQTFHNGRH